MIVSMTGRQAIMVQSSLRHLGGKPVKIEGAVHIAKALQELSVAVEILEERRRSLLKQHALVGDRGEILADEEGNATFPDDSAQMHFSRGYNELLEEKLELEMPLLSARKLGEVEVEPINLAPLLAVGMLE